MSDNCGLRIRYIFIYREHTAIKTVPRKGARNVLYVETVKKCSASVRHSETMNADQRPQLRSQLFQRQKLRLQERR